MDKNIVDKFLENYYPNSVLDVCVLWLIQKHHLYFRPFTEAVVRWLLIEFSKKSLNDPAVLSWLETHSHNVSFYKDLILELWSIYNRSEVEFCGIERIDDIRRHLCKKYKDYSIFSNEERSHLSKKLRTLYNEICPIVICAKRDAFEKQQDIKEVLETIEHEIAILNKTVLIEKYIENLFYDYSFSLYNRILTPNALQEINKAVMMGDREHSHRLELFYARYGNCEVYNRCIGREQNSSNELLCMMTAPQTINTTVNQSDIILTQLNAFASPLAQLGEALNVLLADNNIIFSELKEKLGINIDIAVNITIQNTNTDTPHPNQVQQGTQAVLTSDGCLHLSSPVLDTPKARRVFKKAIEKGLIILGFSGKLTWTGLNPSGKLSQLAYLCEIIYEGNYGSRGNHGKNVPFKELEDLFEVKKLSSTLQQLHDAKRVQAWRAAIEELCK